MEPRKIIKLGNSSYAIALPKDWVDKARLKKGDSVYVLENANGELILTSKYAENNRNKTKEFNLANLDKRSIVNQLRSAYVQDNDILEIKGITRENKNIVKEILQQEMIGFEIIESKDNNIIMKDFFNIQEVHLESFLRKMDNSIRSMLEDLNSLIQKYPAKEKEVLEMYNADQDVNKFYLLITRILFKGLDNPSLLNTLKLDLRQLFHHWWVAFNLEHIADEIKRFTSILKEGDLKKNKLGVVDALFRKIQDTYINSLNFYYKKETQLGKVSLENTDTIRQMLEKYSQKEQGFMREICSRLSSVNRSLYEINKIIFYGLT